MNIRYMMTSNVVTMSANTPISDVFKTLYHRHIGSVVVVDEERRCEGIFTERDAIRVVALDIPLRATLRDVMTKNVITVWDGASFAEAKQLFTAHGIRHLPVVNEGERLIGMLSIRSILDELVGP